MTPDEAGHLLAAYARGRTEWLSRTASALQAGGVWLVGSLATGVGDEWSDLDLIVVGGQPVLDGSLLTIEMPANGPADGGYLGAMYDVAGLPLWVDWYLWPPHAAIPREARLLTGSGTPGTLDLNGTIDHLGRGQPGTPPPPDVFALAMLPLAGKHVARGNHETAAAIAAMLGAQAGTDIAAALIDVLSDLDSNHPAAALVRRHLDVVRSKIRGCNAPA
ncbi:nucleotidyltransferase domain-containing protein [Kribbella sp. NPDC058245]|uniref:nucleotidyltransferase domain-containing protein n=1 Tax=Kribbella sp. NPDC058245 TaxID=3346399 RepID=UPI0036EBF550